MTIRKETKADFPGINEITRAAFRGDFEVALIEKLRGARLVIVSLVAIDDGSVIGHILFSELGVEVDGRRVKSAALAPIAVQPNRQRQGIGSKLIESGLGSLRNRGYEAVIVLGHPDYYPRFGFSAALTGPLAAPFGGEAFVGLELVPGFALRAKGIGYLRGGIRRLGLAVSHQAGMCRTSSRRDRMKVATWPSSSSPFRHFAHSPKAVPFSANIHSIFGTKIRELRTSIS